VQLHERGLRIGPGADELRNGPMTRWKDPDEIWLPLVQTLESDWDRRARLSDRCRGDVGLRRNDEHVDFIVERTPKRVTDTND
jgi:hypothetical protein